MIRKVVIPAAGLGTRLLPITKEFPKEMLPVFFKGKGDVLCLKPILQSVFEQLYDGGFREFVFIGGRGKRAIEDHFSPDESFIENLRGKNKDGLVEELHEFYRKVNNSTIVFLNQPKPKGFGDAVHNAKIFTGDEPFLIHAGDDLILSRNNNHLKRIVKVFEDYNADVVFLVEEVKDPRRYGVIIGDEVKQGVFEVKKIFEKPQEPPSNLGVIALYIFKPIIYRAIEKVEADKSGEVQLTDAISLLLDWKFKVYAVKLKPSERRIDLGTPETYLEILKTMPYTTHAS